MFQSHMSSSLPDSTLWVRTLGMINSGDEYLVSALGGVSSSNHPILLSCPPVEVLVSRNPGPVLSVTLVDVVHADITNFKIADDLINQLVFSLLFELQGTSFSRLNFDGELLTLLGVGLGFSISASGPQP